MNSEWKIVALGDVCEIYRGGSPRPIKNYITSDPSGVNWIKIGDVSPDGKYINRTAERILPSGIKHSRLVERGDFLLSNSMSFGRPYICQIDGCIHDGWLVLKKISNSFVPDYLYYILRSPNVSVQFDQLAKGSTVRNLNRDSAAKVLVPVPPLSEQERIVGILDAAFEKIDKIQRNAERNLENAKELFQQVLDEEMTPEEGWSCCVLPDISINLDHKRIPITKRDRIKGTVPYFGASGIIDYVADFIFDEPLLLISEDGANLLARTSPIAFCISGKTWVNNHAHVLRFHDDSLRRYVEKYLNHISIAKFVSGMAQPKLNQAMLNKIPIWLPRSHDLCLILSKIDEMQQKLQHFAKNHETVKNSCSELKQQILTKAFNGEL